MSKVLIVDDDRTTVTLLKTLLELDGFEIETTGNGADVAAAVASFEPDVILMDYHLADMDGVDVLKELKQGEHAHLPVVMASGLDVENEAIAAGASTFLIKPFEPGDLPALFNSLIQT